MATFLVAREQEELDSDQATMYGDTPPLTDPEAKPGRKRTRILADEDEFAQWWAKNVERS